MKTFSATFLAAIVAAATLVQGQQADASASAAAPVASGAANGAAAGPVSITQPIQGATWKIGGNETVSWQQVQEGVDKLIINLMKGDPTALTLVQALATEIDAAAGSTSVQVPENATEGADYSLAVGSNPSQMAYIGGLTISKDGAASSDASAPTDSTASTPTDGTADAPADGAAAAPADGSATSDESTEGNSAEAPAAAVVTDIDAVPSPLARRAVASSIESGAASAGAAFTSGVGAIPSGAASVGSAATSAIVGAPSNIASAVTNAPSNIKSGANAATSAIASGGAAATSAVTPNTSGATRNFVFGLVMAIPAAVLAMTGF